MVKRTKKEIDKEVKWLNDNIQNIRKLTAFGDNNHEAIEAQIDVLTRNLSDDEIYDNEGIWTEHTLDAALTARRWLDGDEDDSPSSGWEILVQKKGK